MTFTQSQLIAMSGRLTNESLRYSKVAQPGTESFYPNYIISCIFSGMALALHAAYDVGKTAEEADKERQQEEGRQYEGK